MLISIQQPEFMPWMGYFDKVVNVEKVVFLDNVQFKKRYFENRNKIRSKDGWIWLTTPVITKGRFNQDINEVLIDNEKNWQDKIAKTLIINYQRSPYWNEVGLDFIDLIKSKWNKLIDLNISIIQFFLNLFEINRPWVLASDLKTKNSGSDLILEICQKTNASHYLSGSFGKNYLNEEKFISNNVNLAYQDFKHPEYSQIHNGFIHSMSILDLYLNHGIEGKDLLASKNEISKTR